MKREIELVRERYLKRDQTVDPWDYDPLNPVVLMDCQERERKIATLLHRHGMVPVQNKRLIEIGCGNGDNLLLMLRLGFSPKNLVGIELIEKYANRARQRLPTELEVICQDALQYEGNEGSFDIAFQSLVFTSILDQAFQEKLAEKMWKLVKPGGGILWYDFVYNNPGNPDVRGVPIARIRELFPNGVAYYYRVTLAPPISRRVTRIHPLLCVCLNRACFLRTHVLCWIWKRRILKSQVYISAPEAFQDGRIDSQQALVIRQPVREELARMVTIHVEAFPGFFLTFLGPRFLRLLYESILSDPEGVVLVAVNKGELVGFAAGVANQPEFYRRAITHYAWKFGVATLQGMIVNWRIIPRLFRAFRRADESKRHPFKAYLMSIAIDPPYQKGGIGKALIGAFIKEMQRRKVAYLCLTTDKEGNENVNEFYRKLGFILLRDYVTAEGRAMNEYVKDLSATSENIGNLRPLPVKEVKPNG